MSAYALYIHIPFCVHRCAYCDFNTYAGYAQWIPDYVAALCAELRQVADAAPQRIQVKTIFFGGGTPSLLAAAQYARILDTIHQHYEVLPQAEISTEANPGALDTAALKSWRQAGINRLSFGVQSVHADELRLLERIHDFFTVIENVAAARQAGFDNINLDLIYGLPCQSLPRWEENLHWALRLQPEHLSLYALTLEHGTPFARWVARGLLPAPDADLSAEMYALAQDRLASRGYAQYEISNWAQPGRECRHNLTYWRGEPYLGFGAGAHGYAEGTRYRNAPGIRAYVQRIQNGQAHFPASAAAIERRELSRQDEMEEAMMMGLRLTQEGVSEAAFRSRFGLSIEEAFPRPLRTVMAQGLTEWVNFPDGLHLRLRPSAYLLGNQAFMQFIGN